MSRPTDAGRPALRPIVAALGLMVLVGPGCGGTMVARPTDPTTESLERSAVTIEGAVEAAREAAEEQEVIVFRARFNPTSACPCPGWEIELRGRWIRTYLETEPTVAIALEELDRRARADLDAGGVGTWAAVGRLQDDWRLDDVTGLRYPVLVLESIEPSPPPERRPPPD